jgi:hypothetical protein
MKPLWWDTQGKESFVGLMEITPRFARIRSEADPGYRALLGVLDGYVMVLLWQKCDGED